LRRTHMKLAGSFPPKPRLKSMPIFGFQPKAAATRRHPGPGHAPSCTHAGALMHPCGFRRKSYPWVSEGSLAGRFVRHHLALDLVCGADFSWKLMSGAGPGDLEGSRGSESAETPRKTWPKLSEFGRELPDRNCGHIFQPDLGPLWEGPQQRPPGRTRKNGFGRFGSGRKTSRKW